MKTKIFVIFLISVLCSCTQTQKQSFDTTDITLLYTYEKIKTDYEHILSQNNDITNEIFGDTIMDVNTPRYKELMHIADSLETAIFEKYDYKDLKEFFEKNWKNYMNQYQYQNLLIELEEYK